MAAEGAVGGSRSRLDADAVLAAAERSALVTVTQYTAQGSAEIAGESTDLILARHDGRLHVLSRDPGDPATLVPSQWKTATSTTAWPACSHNANRLLSEVPRAGIGYEHARNVSGP